MSIFNVLRYPVSIEFLTEDLQRLPKFLLHDWWQYASTHGKSAENRSRIPPIPIRIHVYLNNSTSKKNRAFLLEKLKSMILELGE